MSVDTITRCRSCQAPIVWAITEAGERMPVDPHPVAGGSVRLRLDERPPRASVVGSTIDLFDRTDDGTRHEAHWATCPDADEWRTA